jgi:hypothetical protein
MAWNTSNAYATSAALTAAIMNGLGNDLRTWGGNVDAGTNSLTNIAQITGAGNLLALFGNVGVGGGASATVRLDVNGPLRCNVASGGGIPSFQAQVDGAPTFTVKQNGFVGIGTANPTAALQVLNIQTYASDALAGAGGLTAGAMYKDAAGGAHFKL